MRRFHCCILHDAFTPAEVAAIHAEWEELLDLKADSAIGEKEASKRSGTRMYDGRGRRAEPAPASLSNVVDAKSSMTCHV